MADQLPAVMADHIGYLLVRAGKRAQRAFEAAIEPLGLRPAEFDTLAVLAEASAATQKEIAALLGVDAARIVGWVDGLEARGLVARRSDSTDRRRNLISLTAAGRKVYRSATEAAAGVQDALADGLRPAEIAELRQALQRIAGLGSETD